MSTQYVLVIPTDIFFSENALRDYLRDNDVPDMLKTLIEDSGYDDAAEMLHDHDYWELGDVVICSYHTQQSSDWPMKLNDDGLFFFVDE